jgi:hypothetical protein
MPGIFSVRDRFISKNRCPVHFQSEARRAGTILAPSRLAHMRQPKV